MTSKKKKIFCIMTKILKLHMIFQQHLREVTVCQVNKAQ